MHRVSLLYLVTSCTTLCALQPPLSQPSIFYDVINVDSDGTNVTYKRKNPLVSYEVDSTQLLTLTVGNAAHSNRGVNGNTRSRNELAEVKTGRSRR